MEDFGIKTGVIVALATVYGLFLAPNRLLALSLDGDAMRFSVVLLPVVVIGSLYLVLPSFVGAYAGSFVDRLART